MILTGSNNCGKTSFTTLALNLVITGQALGVAPAQSLTLTPYEHLATVIQTETDQAKNEGLFKNTCSRAKVIVDLIKKRDGFKMLGLDEAFKGTSDQVAQGALYELIKQAGNNPLVNGIATTHFKSATYLPREFPGRGKFENFKVTEDKRIVPGIGIAGRIGIAGINPDTPRNSNHQRGTRY